MEKLSKKPTFKVPVADAAAATAAGFFCRLLGFFLCRFFCFLGHEVSFGLNYGYSLLKNISMPMTTKAVAPP